jgi:hypothetical protein
MVHSVGLHSGPQPGTASLAQRQKQVRLAHATQHERGAPIAGRRAPSTAAGVATNGGSVVPP